MNDGGKSAEFRMTVLDIPWPGRGCGVGLAVVMETPDGRAWLYDSGNGYPAAGGAWEGNANTGRDQIAPLLQKKGYRKLDGVIISHAHYDHFGGMLWLAEHLPVDLLIDSGYDYSGPRDAHYNRELADYEALRRRFAERPGAYRAVTAGEELDLGGGLRAEVLAPPPGFFRDPRLRDRPADPAAHFMLNCNALIVRITHGDVVFLLGGDIEADDQKRYLLPSLAAGSLRCDVLIAPGHGLHVAPEFAAAARPKAAVASLMAEWIDSCSARREFAARGAEVYVTGIDGTVQIESDGRNFSVKTG